MDNDIILEKKVWTCNEDEVLVQAVEMYGSQGWKVIATNVPGRTMTACKV